MSTANPEGDGETSNREQIRRQLQRHAPRLAELYDAAVCLVSDATLPARLPLAAHAVREIANALPEIVLGVPAGRSSDQLLEELTRDWGSQFPALQSLLSTPEDARAALPAAGTVALPETMFAKLDRMFRAQERSQHRTAAAEGLLLEIDPMNRLQKAALAPILKEWLETTRSFVALSKTPRTSSTEPDEEVNARREEELQEKFRRFEAALRGLLGGFFNVQKEIDDIVAHRGPEALDDLIPLLSVAEQRHQFFNSLDDAVWLRPLEEKGFFATPPDAVPDPATGSTAHAPWPALRYLRRMATRPEVQGDVARIVAALPDSQNLVVNADLAEIALALPPALAAPLARRALKWIHGPRRYGLPRTVATLAVRLAGAGYSKQALRLLSALLSFERRPRTEADEWSPSDVATPMRVEELQDILRSHLRPLVGAAPLKAVELLTRRLNAVLRELRRAEDETGEDYLEVWQPDIGNDAKANRRFEILLVCALRDAMVQAVESQQVSVASLLTVLEWRRWRVFKRLAMYLLERFADQGADHVGRYFLNQELFGRLDAEYQRLLQRAFRLLDPALQEEWLGWIDAGPGEAALRRWFELRGQEAKPEDVAREADAWRWRRLGLIETDLPEHWRPRWLQLRQAFGDPPAPGEDSVRTTFGHWGFKSLLSEEQLRSMSIAEQVACFQAFQRPEEDPFVTPEGQREVLDRVVSQQPERYASEARLFVGVPPTFVRGVVGGLATACEAQRPFPWPAVLDLGQWIVSQPVDEPRPSAPLYEDSGWAWTWSALARLLSTGFGTKAGPARIPLELRPRVWEIIARLVSGPVTVKEWAIEAAINYTFWVRSEAVIRAPFDGDVPEVGRLLAEAISGERRPPPTVHEIYGRLLPWLIALDPGWVATHRTDVFPDETGRKENWEAAWKAYVTNSQAKPHDWFPILRPEYHRAVEGTNSEETSEDPAHFEECMVWHLVVLYVWGDIELTGVNGLMGRFFEVARLRLRKHALSTFADQLEHALELGPQVLERLKALWVDRAARAVTDARVRQELPAFGWWFATGRFDEGWAFEQLEAVLTIAGKVDATHAVVKRLAQLAPAHQREASRLLARLTASPVEALEAVGWIDDARRILVEAVRSGDPVAYSDAMAARDQLGKLGFAEVKHLLPLSENLADPQAIPYFLWDQPMTVAQFRDRLATASPAERERLLAKVLREARDTDVWKFTTPKEVDALWPRLAGKLGRRRTFWEFLLGRWREKGLLAG